MIITSPYSKRNQLQKIKVKLYNINNTEWVNNLFDDRKSGLKDKFIFLMSIDDIQTF